METAEEKELREKQELEQDQGLESEQPTNESEEEDAFEASFAGDAIAPSQVSQDEEAIEESDDGGEEQSASESDAAQADDGKGEEADDNDDTPAEPQFISVEDFNAFKANHQKSLDKIFGRVGDLQHKVEQARTNAQGFSPRMKEKLQKDFPEFAALMYDNDSPAPAAEQSTATEPPQGKDQSDTGAETTEQKFEKKLLKMEHKDWETVVTSDDFQSWKNSALTAREADDLVNSWESDLISQRLTEFKASVAAKVKKPAPKKKPSNRLKAAVQPKGVPRDNAISSDEDDEEAAMMDSYKKR